MGRKIYGFVLSLVVFVSLLLLQPLPPVHAASTLVQQNNAGCTSVTACSGGLLVNFTNPVTSGDVAVVGVDIATVNLGDSINSVADSSGSSFTQAVSSTTSSTKAYIYYAILTSSGTDNVSATFNLCSGDCGPVNVDVYIYEISGVTTAGVATEVGSGSSGGAIATGSTAFSAGAFLLGVFAANPTSFLPPVSASAGTGFSLSTQNSGSGTGYAETATGLTSPTTFPATIGSNTVSWAEAGIALEPGTIVVTTLSSTVVSTESPSIVLTGST